MMAEFMVSINPATGERIASCQTTPEADIEQALKKAHSAFAAWKRVPFVERSNYLRSAAAILDERKYEYGRMMALAMGKPLAQGVAEAESAPAPANSTLRTQSDFSHLSSSKPTRNVATFRSFRLGRFLR